jgi:hypothetical protein
MAGATMRPMPSPARRLATVVVLLLSLAILAFVGLRAAGVPIGIGQVVSPIPATPSAEPSAPASQDPLTVFAQIESQVQALRALPAASIGPPELITRADLGQRLPGLLEPPLDSVTLQAMGLPGAREIVALTYKLYTAQVLGYYDFDTKRMVVVTDAGLTPEARITYAHEYTHALQDAAFDSGTASQRVKGQRDRELALLGLEEGDASVAMVLWALAHLSSAEMAGITSTPLPDMSGIPAWMVHLLEYPYLSGAAFVSQLYASGGWEAVDAVYADLPASSEQVLHPAKYLAREAPIVVKALDLLSVLPAGWTQVSDSTMGEEWLATWLEGINVEAGAASAAAAGWGGDHLTVVDATDGSWALGWRIDWDTSLDATEFAAAYMSVNARAPFPTRLVQASARETVVLQASSAQVLATIAALVRPYIDSTAEIPSRPSALASTWRVASVSASRARESGTETSSSGRTRQSR